MKIAQIRNRGVRHLPANKVHRRWLEVGSVVFLGEARRRLDITSESQDGEPRQLLLVLTDGAGVHEIRVPEDLALYTTDALIRAVEYDEGGVSAVLLDTGHLVAAPVLAVMP